MPPTTAPRKQAALFALAACLILFALPATAQTDTSQTTAIPPEALDSLRFRNIGPAVTGGRIHDVEALPDDPSTIYVATASGGLWKSTNKGTTWKPIFEGKPVSTFGDLAIAPSNPDVLWAGTGEQNNRQSTSWGNGVYRSTDAGETWAHLGLEETRHIGKVRVHPENPDVAYVAALGNLWKASPERGVFKTSDGGETWDKVFYADSLTGVVDLVMDPRDPDVLYAAAYQRLRRTWGFNGGGPGSGIFKTSDGGQTWEELMNGIPEGDKGRIGLAIAENSPDVLYATVQHADESGTYRTSDGGQTWEKVNELNPRPMYYSHLFVDPENADRVYVLGVEFYVSEDGGATFRQMPTRPTYDVGVHSDHHSLWIDPSDTEHFYLAGDAGLHETWDRGETYSHINNFPIGQFYAIGLDMREPYRIYGGMQDNHSWMGPSATRRYIGIINDDWMQIGFGDGMYQQADPTNGRYAYVTAQNGNLARLDAETGDLLDIAPYPPEGEEYRFDWVNPVILSRHDPQTIYFGGNRLFISKDRGVSWTRTDDLTKAIERDSLYLMGVQGADTMLSENDGTSTYSEIITIAESPLDAQILWVGTDDGNVQLSQDGGATWNEVSGSIDGVGDTTYVSRVMASSKSPGTAFVTFDAHRDGDFLPYVYRTSDFGETWTTKVYGLPEVGSVNVIAEHPDNPDVLFLGTEHALFVSTNAGDAWTPFTANLPTTHYDDLAIHPREKDLVLGTHGRSIWILDDTTPIAEWTSAAASDSAHLFSIQPATFFHYWKNTSYRGQAAYNGENPAFGALISYHLPTPVDSVRLVITSAEGDTVRTLAGPGSAGAIQRVAWDLEHTPPPDDEDEDEEEEGLVVPDADSILPKLPRPNNPRGPFVAPGTYTVTLEAGDTRVSQPVEVRGDPEMEISQEQYETREAFLLDVLALQREAFEAAEEIGALSDEFSAHRDSLGEGEDLPEDMAVRADTAKSRAGRLDQLRGRVYGLAGEFNGRGVRQGTLYPPTETHRARLEQLQEALRREMNTPDAQEQEEEGSR